MATSPIVPILIGVGLVGGGIAASQVMASRDAAKRKKKKKGANGKSPAGLANVYHAGATVGNSPEVVSEVVPPLVLGQLSKVYYRPPGSETYGAMSNMVITMQEATASTAASPDKKIFLPNEGRAAVAGLVTNLSAEATTRAWQLLKEEVKIDGGVVFDEPSGSVDRALERVLTQIKPDVVWKPLVESPDDHHVNGKIVNGVMLLGELLYQSIWNEYAANEDLANGGGGDPSDDGGSGMDDTPPPPPPPGGSGNATVDRQWDNYFDRGDLQGIIRVRRAGNFGPTVKNFFSQMRVFEDDNTRNTGTYTGVVNYDSPTDEGLIVIYGTEVDPLFTRLSNLARAKEQSL